MMTRKKQGDIHHLSQELLRTIVRCSIEHGRPRDTTGSVILDLEVVGAALGRVGAISAMLLPDEAERMKAYAEMDKAFMEAQHWHERERPEALPRAA